MDHYQPLFEAADQFIQLANKLAQEDNSGTVGAALRYAAARYNAFEASLDSANLSTNKGQLLDDFSNDYRQMLSVNINQYTETP